MKGKKIGEGRTAEIFGYGEGKILKLFRTGFSRDGADWEYRQSRAASEVFTKAPKVFDKLELEGRYGIVFEHLTGETGVKLLGRKPWLARDLAKQMAELQLEMLKIDAVNLPDQKAQMIYAIERVEELTAEEKDKIVNYLKSLPVANKLCHGDFHPDNYFISETGPRVIDWITASCGCPECDIARTSLLLDSKAIPENAGFLLRIMIMLVKKSFFKRYRKTILKLSALKWPDIEMWQLPLAAARLIEGNPPDEQKDLLAIVRRKLRAL